MSDGFLGRWSRRKLGVKEGKTAEPEPVAQAAPPPQVEPGREVLEQPAGPASATERAIPAAPEQPPPTLEDVKALTADSDFARFAAPNVAPEVKNAALKKLFSDPHYNIMDRLDVYIDDYSQPDPMSESMVRQLASVKFLGLFAREEAEEQAQAQASREARDDSNNPTPETVAQSERSLPAVPEPPENHADPDLRLQQDDAAPGEDPGHGAG
jgi:hypothetical protein